MEAREQAREPEVRALREGRAFVDLSHWGKASISGADAASWLNDLVTAGVEGLEPLEARRSLLLTPTGRVRADFMVMRHDPGFLLVQDPGQPRSVADLLEPYVLSSDVRIRDATGTYGLFVLPGAAEPPRSLAPAARHPSAVGDGYHGYDLLCASAARDGVRRDLLGEGLVESGLRALEACRIVSGRPRFTVDFDEESLPAEAGLEHAIDFAKGCFLGQESVARVRNLGHPPRVVVALRAAGAVAPGDPVVADGREVGRVTSAATLDGETALLAAVRWEARDAALATGTGLALRRAG